jgi:hypothetical protein
MPTLESVNAECQEFDRDPSTQLIEDALRQLREHFRKNVEPSHVLLKVVALNKLYSTNIINVEAVARHIVDKEIDDHLSNGSPEIVDLIANVTIGTQQRNNFSFATKYCSWHNPTAYAIWDGNVDECLWHYRNQDHFAKFKRKDISSSYDSFLKVIADFRSHYNLTSVSLRDLDKFLWQVGGKILEDEKNRKAERAGEAQKTDGRAAP